MVYEVLLNLSRFVGRFKRCKKTLAQDEVINELFKSTLFVYSAPNA